MKINIIKKTHSILLLCIILISLLISCQSDDDSENGITNNETILHEWELVFGNGDSNNYNIGVVFEAKDNNASQETYKSLLDRMMGNGDFSLFKTIPFKDNKDKFNIYYAVISKSNDKNELPYPENELSSIRVRADNYFTKNKEQFINSNDPIEINSFAKSIATAAGFDLNKAENSFFYADGLALSLGGLTTQKTDIIKRNIKRFDALFNQKNFNTQVYISKGIDNGYTNTSEKRKKIYMGYAERTIFGLIKSELVHPDHLAILFTHEFGHAFALFSDEYYPIEKTLGNIDKDAFSNNTVNTGYTFNQTIFNPIEEKTNPWLADKIPVLINERNEDGTGVHEYDYILGPIPFYNGVLVEGGNGRYGAYRTSQNSIMRFYLQISKEEWQNSWSPVQKFYIDYFLNTTP